MIVQDTCKPLFAIWPLDYRSADMLPVIEIMAQRFVSGGAVYDIIPEIWGGMKPIYLPALWMPFILSSLTSIDMRWVGIGMLLVGTLLLLRPWKKALWTPTTLAIMTLTLLAIWMTWLFLDQGTIALTEEGVVIGYYAILCLAIISKRPILIGLAIGLCTLSRYILIPWALMFVIAIWFWRSRRDAYKIILSAGTLILLLMTIGQGWSAISVFMTVPDNYVASVLADKAKYTPLIDSSLGLAKFWNYESLGSLHFIMKAMALAIPIICLWVYKKWFSEIPFTLFGLISLKLSLVFFYNLLVMPYGYLFYTSTIISIAILGFVLTRIDPRIVD